MPYFCLKSTPIMRKFLIISFCLGMIACNDGDIITVELDFEDSFKRCGELVFYKTKDDPSESLSIVFNSVLTIDSFLNVDEDGIFVSGDLACVFNYRTYNASLPNDYFCNDIPPSSVTIISDEESDGSSAVVTTVLIEDDNDGIEAEMEDINGDGDLDNDDTDGDGLPNYLDMDDDGDNVPTVNENPDPNNDDDLTDAQDTDLDGIPDYLDTDDDGDGVLTRDEETDSQDQNPTNDIDNASIGPDYLNDMFSMSVPATAFRIHTVQQTFEISCVVNDIQISNLTQQSLNLGMLTPNVTDSRSLTPPFN